MCSAAAGIGVASAVQNYFGSQAQAKAQYASEMAAYQQAQANWEIDKRQADERKKLLEANAILQLQQIQAAQQETNDAAAEQKAEIARELMRAREASLLAAGEANVSGNSVNRILSDIGFTEQSKLAAVEASRENQISQLQSEKQNAIQGSKMSPIYSVIGPAPKYNGNNGLSLLSAAISGFGTYTGLARTSTSTAASSSCGTAVTTSRCGS